MPRENEVQIYRGLYCIYHESNWHIFLGFIENIYLYGHTINSREVQEALNILSETESEDGAIRINPICPWIIQQYYSHSWSNNYGGLTPDNCFPSPHFGQMKVEDNNFYIFNQGWRRVREATERDITRCNTNPVIQSSTSFTISNPDIGISIDNIVSENPMAPAEGSLMYNTQTNTSQIYCNGQWINITENTIVLSQPIQSIKINISCDFGESKNRFELIMDELEEK